MDIIRRNITIRSYWVMLVLSIVLAALFVALYFITDSSQHSKEASLYAGFASAFLVAFVQLLTSILEALRLHKYESMGIREILEERRDYEYYQKLIAKSKKEILVMGVTASRFLRDFASGKTNNTKTLIEALSRGVNVKILLPKLQYLSERDRGTLKDVTLKLYNELRTNHQNITIKFFDHIPAHSLVLVDDTCIAGPVFKTLDSMYTPAVVLNRTAKYASTYIDNFRSEWDAADESE